MARPSVLALSACGSPIRWAQRLITANCFQPLRCPELFKETGINDKQQRADQLSAAHRDAHNGPHSDSTHDSHHSGEERDRYWLQRALQLAEQAAAAGEVPVGALLLVDGQLVAESANCVIANSDPCGHAEVRVLREAARQLGNYRLPGAVLYVTIEPCTMCFGAMVHARVSELIYAAPEPRAGVAHSNLGLAEAKHFNHRIQVRQGPDDCAEQASEIMRTFFAARRK